MSGRDLDDKRCVYDTLRSLIYDDTRNSIDNSIDRLKYLNWKGDINEIKSIFNDEFYKENYMSCMTVNFKNIDLIENRVTFDINSKTFDDNWWMKPIEFLNSNSYITKDNYDFLCDLYNKLEHTLPPQLSIIKMGFDEKGYINTKVYFTFPIKNEEFLFHV